jgi:tetratricopeptide (TPR) repeat protein
MEDFKQYLSEGADDRERDAAKQVMEGLAGIRLENKVAEVAAERRAWLRRRFWRRVLFVAALVIIAGVAFLVFWGKGNDKTQKIEQPGIQLPIATDNPPDVSPQTPPEKQEEKKGNGPIAQNKVPDRLPSPRFPSPNIRGENSENKAWKALLDHVWYTEYPMLDLSSSETFGKADQFLRTRDFSTAYVQLQRLERKIPENDTLRLLKGYCLMEMGEGAEALTYFEKIKGKQPSWEATLQWNQGLSLLLTGDKEKALKAFRAMAAQPRHPYHAQSKRVIQVLE